MARRLPSLLLSKAVQYRVSICAVLVLLSWHDHLSVAGTVRACILLLRFCLRYGIAMRTQITKLRHDAVCRSAPSGNEAFVTAITQWVFGERGVLKACICL